MEDKTKAQLLSELAELRRRVADLETAHTRHKQAEEAQLAELNRLKQRLLAPGSLDEKLKLITDGVVVTFGADFARIWITRESDLCEQGCRHAAVSEGPDVCRNRTRCLHLVASSGRYTHLDGDHRRVPFGCYKIGRVASGEDPKFITNDVVNDPRVHDHEWARSLGLVSFAGYRLLSTEGKPIGVLALFSQRVLVPDEEKLVEDLANSTSQVIVTGIAEEALRHSNLELQARNEDLDAFAHTVAHDLKNPVGLVIGYAEVLDRDYTVMADEQRLKLLRSIARSGRKIENIINELLLLAQVRKIQVSTGPLDMGSIVSEAQGHLTDMLERSGAKIVSPEASAWPPAMGYGPWVEEVWVNYLDNALKYSGQPPHIELGATAQPDGAVRFWVRDNGPGLTAEEQARLFMPFTRLDQARARGQGLGLSIVRRIVEKLDGQAGVESEPGKGSTFWFSLPGVRPGPDI